MSSYTVILFLHSLLRWVVLGAGVYVVVRALSGVLGAKPYDKADRAGNALFVSGLHLNFVLGLLMYFALSPITSAAFSDMSQAMKTAALRFFVVEHPFGMLLAVALATVGSARIKRASEPAAKHKRALVFQGIALFLVFASIPWPFYPAGRPLLFLG
jgi:Na+-driven multidrug efflux pump